MGYGTYKDFPGEPLGKRPFWIRGMPQAFDDLPGPQGSISLAVVVDDIDCADAVVFEGDGVLACRECGYAATADASLFKVESGIVLLDAFLEFGRSAWLAIGGNGVLLIRFVVMVGKGGFHFPEFLKPLEMERIPICPYQCPFLYGNLAQQPGRALPGKAVIILNDGKFSYVEFQSFDVVGKNFGYGFLNEAF